MAKALACPLPRDAPALRLVCLPHAGGAAAATAKAGPATPASLGLPERITDEDFAR